MYTKEQAIEAVEFITGQKVERINFKHVVNQMVVDSIELLTPRDTKRVFFICSYDVSFFMENMTTNEYTFAQMNLNFLDGSTQRVPFYLSHNFPFYSMTYQAGFVVSDISCEGFSTNSGAWTPYGVTTFVYYECFLSN